MKNSPLSTILRAHPAATAALATALVMALLTWLLQRYRMAELEECYILLYDRAFISSTLARAGGLAQLAASALTQWMYLLWFGPLAAGAVYGLITWLLLNITPPKSAASAPPKSAASSPKAALWTIPLALLPSICLFLCLENNSYKFQGHTALLIATALLCWAARRGPGPVGAILATVLCYWGAGSAAWVTALGITLLALPARRWLPAALAPAACLLCALTATELEAVPTLTRALTPGMYYEWDTTYFMMLYAWIGTLLYIAAAVLATRLRLAPWLALLLLAAEFGIAANIYRGVHSPGVYRTQTQRYMARSGDWDGILALDYSADDGTPFTSYRMLALAHKGLLLQELPRIRPYIGYYMQNKTLVKKEDLEVLSDIFYDCRYMAAARRYAFDTDIVTPGAFNPPETLKLAAINIAYGHYAVASRLLSQLEKTMRYAPEARRLRALLGDDAAVEADPELGPMRRAIPSGPGWTSPRATARELRHVVDALPDAEVARQFYQTFTSLTGIE